MCYVMITPGPLTMACGQQGMYVIEQLTAVSSSERVKVLLLFATDAFIYFFEIRFFEIRPPALYSTISEKKKNLWIHQCKINEFPDFSLSENSIKQTLFHNHSLQFFDKKNPENLWIFIIVKLAVLNLSYVFSCCFILV